MTIGKSTEENLQVGGACTLKCGQRGEEVGPYLPTVCIRVSAEGAAAVEMPSGRQEDSNLVVPA